MSVSPAASKRINQRLLAFAALGLVAAIAIAPHERTSRSNDASASQSDTTLRRADSSRSLAAR